LDTTDEGTPTTPQDALNAIFDLPSSRQTLLWQHAALAFPPKETLIATVQAGNLSKIPLKQRRDTLRDRFREYARQDKRH